MKSHSRELQTQKTIRISKNRESLESKWKTFKPLMNCDLFHTTALIDGKYQLCTLIDPRSSAFATISEKFVNNLKLNKFPLTPRVITGVLSTISGVIDKVASISLDVGGLRIENAWAYVVPNQGEDLILGMPWLKYCHAELNPVHSKLIFRVYNLELISNEARQRLSQTNKSALKVNQVSTLTFAGLARRAKCYRTEACNLTQAHSGPEVYNLFIF